MSSKKAGKLALLTAGVNCDSELPAPSTRTKRNHSTISALTAADSPARADRSFELIMRDPHAMAKSKESETKHKKSRNFMEPIKSGIQPEKLILDPSGTVICGYKFRNQRLSSESINICLKGRELVPFSSLDSKIQAQRRFWRSKTNFTGDFVTVGVVCHTWVKEVPGDEVGKNASPAASSSSPISQPMPENSYSSKSPPKRFLIVVRLSDLKRTSVSLILEPSQQAGFAISYGDVVAILNPGFLNAVDGDGAVLKVKNPAQVCILGQSSEIGICTYRNPVRSAPSGSKSLEKGLPTLSPLTHDDSATKEKRGTHAETSKREAVCPNFINIETSEYCEFHMYEMFDNVKSNRMVLNDASGGALSIKKKRKEFSSAAKHLSDGVFVLLGLKWRISERDVKLMPSNEHGVLPTATEMYGMK
jgi:hypothetical protein